MVWDSETISTSRRVLMVVQSEAFNAEEDPMLYYEIEEVYA